MGFDAAGEDLELDVPVGVDRDDSGDLWIGALVAHHYMAAHRLCLGAGAAQGSGWASKNDHMSWFASMPWNWGPRTLVRLAGRGGPPGQVWPAPARV